MDRNLVPSSSPFSRQVTVHTIKYRATVHSYANEFFANGSVLRSRRKQVFFLDIGVCEEFLWELEPGI